MIATVAPPSVRPTMICRRGTGATSVSLRNPNCRSHSRPMPEKIDENSTDIADHAGRDELQVAALPRLLEDRTEAEPEHQQIQQRLIPARRSICARDRE